MGNEEKNDLIETIINDANQSIGNPNAIYKYCSFVTQSALSKILNKKILLTVDHLDDITNALGKEPGHYYPLYEKYVFDSNQISKSKSKSILFVPKCYPKHEDIAERILDAIKSAGDGSEFETLIQISYRLYLFGQLEKAEEIIDDVLERITKRNAHYASVLLLKHQIERETPGRTRTESFYDLVNNLQLFETEYEFIDIDGKWRKTNIYLDALVMIVRHSYRTMDLIQCGKYADLLLNEQEKNRCDYSIVLKSHNTYEADGCVYAYVSARDHSNIHREDLLERMAGISDYYKHIAEGNRFLYRVRSGDLSVVPAYSEWVSTFDDGTFFITEALSACVRQKSYDLFESLIEKYYKEIHAVLTIDDMPYFQRRMSLNSSFATYHLYKGTHEDREIAVNHLISNLITATKINQVKDLRKTTAMIFKNYDLFSNEAKERIQYVLDENEVE